MALIDLEFTSPALSSQMMHLPLSELLGLKVVTTTPAFTFFSKIYCYVYECLPAHIHVHHVREASEWKADLKLD